MQKKIKYLIFLIVFFVYILHFCRTAAVMPVSAADADANAGNNSYVNSNGIRIFPLGCRSRWSGFIVYIIDGDTNLKSEVKVVLSKTTKPKYNPEDSMLYTRFGGGSVDLATADFDTGGIGGYAPFDNDGNACGGDIRDWMLSQSNDGNYNIYSILEEYFKADIENITHKFVDNDWYLIIEPFFWYGYYAKDEATGDVNFTGYWVCGTAPMIAEQENFFNFAYDLDSPYGSTYFRRYTNRNFPNCCRFARSQFGLNILLQGNGIKSMPTNDEIINYAYGIMSFWAGDITVEDMIPVTDTVEDTEKTVSVGKEPLYYTGNRVEGYDVSDSVPTDSIIKNVATAASYCLENLTVGVRKYTRHYSMPITLYEETVFQDGSSERKAVYSGCINAEAKVTFEYMKEVPDVFKLDIITVKNRVYEGGAVRYAHNEDFFNSVIVDGEVYNDKNGKNSEKLEPGISFVPGSAHFELPDGDEAELTGVEAVINTVNLEKKADRPCTNPDCDNGWIDDWEWCEECDGDGYITGTDEEECSNCDDGKISITMQCGSCYGTGSGGTVRCSSCGSQSFETYQICGKCGAEGEPGDSDCFNCNGNGYTSKSWIDAWTEYVPDEPCGVCDGTGWDSEENEECYLCGGVGNAGTPHYHEGEWSYNECGTCGGTGTVFICPATGCNGDGDNFTEMERCKSCGNSETTNDCEDCDGTGRVEDTVSCSKCGGDGVITKNTKEDCDECGGSGQVDTSYECSVCGGEGIIKGNGSVINENNRYFTADEIIAAAKEHAGTVAQYINENSSSHNDSFRVKDNGTVVWYMKSDMVEGAEVKVSLEGTVLSGKANADETAADYTESSGTVSDAACTEGGNTSDSPCGVEACVEAAPLAEVIEMKSMCAVEGSFGMGSAATGIEIHYEHVMYGADIEMYAGKAVFGGSGIEADSIYNHVLKGYKGMYHNGGDPDDGYPIVVSENAVEVTTTPEPETTTAPEVTEPVTTSPAETAPGETTKPSETTKPGETTKPLETKPGETTTTEPEVVIPVSYFDIVDCNFTRQTRPSSQLVDVMDEAEYYLTLDGSYYLFLAAESEDNKHVTKKEMQFPFDVYYDGTYYKADASGYTEWIEINEPDNYKSVWDEGISVGDYESNNHWQVTPVYIPLWAAETDSEKPLRYVRARTTFKTGSELVDEAGVQLSGILYGFTVTGINDINQYYKAESATGINTGESINFSAATKKLEWRVGIRNRIGGSDLRYLVDGTLINMLKDCQTLPIRKGSGDGSDFARTGDGEMSLGTSFSFVIKSVSDLKESGDYIEIVPHFKYLTSDGSVVTEESLLVLYEYSDTKWYIAGDSAEKSAFKAACAKDAFADGTYACLEFERFKGTYYDAAAAAAAPVNRYGDWIKYTFEEYNKRLPVNEKTDIHKFIKGQHLTNFWGIAGIPAGLRLYSGEFEQLAVNLDKEPYEVVTYMDYNQDGINDDGYDADRFRQSMQTWYGNYMVNKNIYIVNKSVYPEFWVDGKPIRPEADERIMRGGKLIIGFEINAYKNGKKHLTYGDMWQTEGQKCYTVKEYITDDDFNDAILSDSLMIDYGDVAVVDINDKLSDDYWNTGNFVIN